MGLFSNYYTKEGKGVDKNAPQKNAFFRFFEYYHRSFQKLLVGNFLYCLFALPILTFGIAESGLTYICRAAAQDQHSFGASDFWDTVKKNWKQSLIAGLIDGVIYAILGFDIYYAYGCLMQPEVSLWDYLYFGIALMILLIFRFSANYRYTILISFKMKLTQIYKNSFIFAMAGLGANIIIAVAQLTCYALAILLVVTFNYYGGALVLIGYVLLFPAFRCYVRQYCTFPAIKKHMIDPYYAEHPDEDIDLRRRLGLLPQPEGDAIFSDELLIPDDEQELQKHQE